METIKKILFQVLEKSGNKKDPLWEEMEKISDTLGLLLISVAD